MSVNSVGHGPSPASQPTPDTKSPSRSIADVVKHAVETVAQGVRDAIQRAFEQRNSDTYSNTPPRPDESQTIQDFVGAQAQDAVYHPQQGEPVFHDLLYRPGQDQVEMLQVHVITTPKPGSSNPRGGSSGGYI
ncbi:MAG: hypothetical protein JXR83_10900 [Deltaproteobacteria bacterium]|nr:hypothetical protein [Deltaproteobacteria bacterium]